MNPYLVTVMIEVTVMAEDEQAACALAREHVTDELEWSTPACHATEIVPGCTPDLLQAVPWGQERTVEQILKGGK